VNHVHVSQADYDLLLDKGKIDASWVNCFSGVNPDETFLIMVDGSGFGSQGKFVDDQFCMLGTDGKFIVESAEAFRNLIKRLCEDKIVNDDVNGDDHILALRLKDTLEEYVKEKSS
jgi:hypothetical protein